LAEQRTGTPASPFTEGGSAVLQIIENHPELSVWTLLIVAVAVCYITRVVSGQWRAIRQAEFEFILKEQMIQKGMSAREIMQVMEAGQEPVELQVEPSAYHRPSPNRRWLWLALGVPVAMFVLCGGFMMVMASAVVVSFDESVPIVVDEAPALDDWR
jgi:hypothetical protein